MGKKFNKDILEAGIGASIIPTTLGAIDSADMGALGTASKVAVTGGFALKLGKKVL